MIDEVLEGELCIVYKKLNQGPGSSPSVGVLVMRLSQSQNHRLDLSLKLESLTLVSWLRFMLESEEMSDDLVVLEEREDLDMVGEESGSGPWSAKYG